jgi:HD superfamily phosphodiesterase
VLLHSIEVSHIAGLLAAELGVDVMMASGRAYHDIARLWTMRSRVHT